jgi:uncharacterized membrane protein
MSTIDEPCKTPRRGASWPVDLARAGALGMMAVFHFVYDLELFGWVRPGPR